MNNFNVDKTKAVKKWDRILESLNVNTPSKKEWMAEYAELHTMNESVSYSTPMNTNGMGAVVAPQPGTVPGAVWGDGTAGSGDVGQNLLPISMKIAAQTIGLDLVAVKPIASPKVDLVFVDYVYDGENKDDKSRPLVFKLKCDDVDAFKALLKREFTTFGINEMISGIDGRMFVDIAGTNTPVTTVPATKTNVLEFIGFSRVDGLPMFRTFRQAVERASYLYGFDAAENTFAQNGSVLTQLDSKTIAFTDDSDDTTADSFTIVNPVVELVSMLEDHLPGFAANWNLFSGQNREQDENTYSSNVGTTIFTKSIQVGNIELTASTQRTQMEDIKAATGMDIVQKLEGMLVNDLSQNISKEIVEKIKGLGEKNRASHTTPKVGAKSAFDFDVDTYVASWGNAGGETSHALQRKLITKINNAKNFISNDGRVGPAQYIVTSGTMASVIQDIANYQVNPVVDGVNTDTNGQLYPMGKVGQMTIYVDPNMRWDDNRIFLGRKNNADQPGLLFMPYLMAQSVSLISEANFAPRMLLRSRYAVADVGFFPEKQFMAIHVKDEAGFLA